MLPLIIVCLSDNPLWLPRLCWSLRTDSAHSFILSYRGDTLFFWVQGCQCIAQTNAPALLHVLANRADRRRYVRCKRSVTHSKLCCWAGSLITHCQPLIYPNFLTNFDHYDGCAIKIKIHALPLSPCLSHTLPPYLPLSFSLSLFLSLAAT